MFKKLFSKKKNQEAEQKPDECAHDASDFMKTTKAHICEYGYSVTKVFSTDYNPSFAYSVGLHETYGHPEIICFGLKLDTLHTIINDVVQIIRDQGGIDSAKVYDDSLFQGSRSKFLEVNTDNVSDYFGAALEHYQHADFSCLQLIWTDRNNVFPWETGFEKEFKHIQPLLDRNMNFKFREEENLAVFTTKSWLDNRSRILRVVHDDDGDWQFFPDAVAPTSDKGVVVCLKDMIAHDPSLNQCFNLEYGETAKRESTSSLWVRSKAS